METYIVYFIKELQVTLSNCVVNSDLKYNNLWIQIYSYRGQGNDEIKDNKICASMDEVAKKEKSFLPRPLTVFYQESRNESTSYNPK